MSANPERDAKEAEHRANWDAQRRHWWEHRRGGRDKLSRADLLDLAAGLPPPPTTQKEWIADIEAQLAGGQLLQTRPPTAIPTPQPTEPLYRRDDPTAFLRVVSTSGEALEALRGFLREMDTPFNVGQSSHYAPDDTTSVDIQLPERAMHALIERLEQHGGFRWKRS